MNNGGSREKEIESISNRLKELEDKIPQDIEILRINLISQEHRFYHTIRNLILAFKDSNGSPKSNEEKLAAVSAFGMAIWKRNMIAIGAASIGGLAGLVIAIFTLFEFKKQNTAILDQNDSLIEQNNLFRTQNRQQLVSTNGQMVSGLVGDLYQSKVRQDIGDGKSWKIPATLIYRIITVSNALSPYDNVDSESRIPSVSRERGEMLKAIVSLNCDFPLDPNPNFSFTNLANSKLPHSDLQGINLINSNLSRSDFNHAIFSHAILDKVDMHGTILDSAQVKNAELSDAILVSCNFTSSDFTETYLTHSDLENASLVNTNFSNANLTGASLKGATIVNTNFNGAILDSVDFTDAIILDPRLFGTVLSMKGATFDDDVRMYLLKSDILNN
jgi:uncharacterized protein YjbI with pentapeptide repeats